MLKIGDFARLAKVSVKLLRHYHDIGLLRAHETDRSTGYRYYSLEQLTRLNRVLVYRSLGFSLKDIHKLIGVEASAAELREILAERRSALAARIRTECARLDEVEARIAQIDGESSAAQYDVTIRSIDSHVAISLRRECESYDQVSELLERLRQRLPAHAAVAGYGAVWHRCLGSAHSIDCEALVFVHRGFRLAGDLAVIELPACTVASVVYEEAAEQAGPAYRAAIDRASRLGYQVAGPMREHYLQKGLQAGLIEAQFPLSLMQ